MKVWLILIHEPLFIRAFTVRAETYESVIELVCRAYRDFYPMEYVRQCSLDVKEAEHGRTLDGLYDLLMKVFEESKPQHIEVEEAPPPKEIIYTGRYKPGKDWN